MSTTTPIAHKVVSKNPLKKVPDNKETHGKRVEMSFKEVLKQKQNNGEIPRRKNERKKTPFELALDHKPTTGILERIKELIPDMGILKNFEITPEIALDMLTVNKGNRGHTLNTYLLYTSEMKEDRWQYNGDNVRFDEEGFLLNGQHTLAAIYESGKPQRLNVQAGIPRASFSTMDIGRTRTAGDVLGIAGFYKANILAAAVKTEIYYRKFGRIATNIRSQRVSHTEIEKWTRTGNVKMMLEAVVYGENELRRRGRFFATSSWAFLYYTLSKVNKQQAIDFLSRLATGANIAPTGRHKAIYMLRERLESFYTLKQHSKDLAAGGSKVLMIKMSYTFRAWNAWRNNEHIDKLKIDTDKLTLEKPQ